MAISIRETNREPGWFAAFWRAFSSPSFAGVTMLLAAGVLIAFSLLPDPGLIILGRVIVVVGLGSVLATTIGIVARPRYFGRAMAALGFERRVSIPVFQDRLAEDKSTSTSRWFAVSLRLGLFVLIVGVPLTMAMISVFDQSLTGAAVLTEQKQVESVTVATANTQLKRDLSVALTLGAEADPEEGRAEIVATNTVTLESQRPMMQVGERLHMNSEYVSLSGWRPTLSTRIAALEILSEDGDVIKTARLTEGSSVEIMGVASLELLGTRDAFLELLGPAAHVRVTNADGDARELWTFSRAPDFDLRHGDGTHRVRLLGFEPGTAAVVQIRNSAGQRWDLWAVALFGAFALLIFARSVPSGFLTGQSGDYLYVGPTPWFFSTEVAESDRQRIEHSLTRPETSEREIRHGDGEGA